MPTVTKLVYLDPVPGGFEVRLGRRLMGRKRTRVEAESFAKAIAKTHKTRVVSGEEK